MVNITEEGRVEIPFKKSKFQQLVDKVNPHTRIQMVQLGLNPFNEEDIAHFHELTSKGNKLSWGQRFSAAWIFLWKKEINNNLLVAALKKVNDSMETEMSYDNLVDTSTKPDPITEKLMKRPPQGLSSAAKHYEGQLKDALVDRVAKAVQNGEMPNQTSTEGKVKTQTKPFKNTTPPAPPAPMVPKPKKKKKFYKSPSNTKKPKK